MAIKIDERHAVKEDDKLHLSLTLIPDGQVPLLLNYLTSLELHEKDIKGHIVDFLKKNGAVIFDEDGKPNMESYTYASIYFNMRGDYDYYKLKALNLQFDAFIKPFEDDTSGKIFWTIQYLATFQTTSGRTIARTGFGNKQFNDDFQSKITPLLKS